MATRLTKNTVAEVFAPLGASLEGRWLGPFILRGPRKSAATSG